MHIVLGEVDLVLATMRNNTRWAGSRQVGKDVSRAVTFVTQHSNRAGQHIVLDSSSSD